jgi:hypothetical protein
MAETMGSLIDKICIAELKMYHIREQVNRPDAAEGHRTMCRTRLAVMERQRNDLVAELNELTRAWSRRQWRPKVYRQFKMYNDPRFRPPGSRASQGGAA